MLKFYWYPKCSTCRNAKKWLDENKKEYETIDIVATPPTKQEITELYQNSDLPIQKFFNTSGVKYKELGLKDIVKTASEEGLLNWLASDGKLLKRPIVTNGEKVTVGYNSALFTDYWS